MVSDKLFVNSNKASFLFNPKHLSNLNYNINIHSNTVSPNDKSKYQYYFPI